MSLFHFELIFVYSVRECVGFIFTSNCQVFPAPFTEDTVFSPLFISAFFDVNSLTVSVWVYYWNVYPAPLVYVYMFVTVLHCFNYCSFGI